MFWLYIALVISVAAFGFSLASLISPVDHGINHWLPTRHAKRPMR